MFFSAPLMQCSYIPWVGHRRNEMYCMKLYAVHPPSPHRCLPMRLVVQQQNSMGVVSLVCNDQSFRRMFTTVEQGEASKPLVYPKRINYSPFSPRPSTKSISVEFGVVRGDFKRLHACSANTFPTLEYSEPSEACRVTRDSARSEEMTCHGR